MAAPRHGLLLKVLVYNPTVNDKEEQQHLNVFYAYPKTLTKDETLMDVGFCCALQGLHGNFESDSTLKSMCTDRYLYCWYEPEPDWWMCVVSRRRHSQPQGTGDQAEYCEDPEVQPIRALLRQCYQQYRMHHGPLQQRYSVGVEQCRPRRAGDHPGAVDVRRCMDQFMDLWVQQASQVLLQNVDIFDSLEGIKYLPADRPTYLKVYSLMTQLESTFSDSVVATSVIVDDLLLYTGLALEDTHTLYRFVTRRRQRQAQDRPTGADNVLHLSHVVPSAVDFCGFLTSTVGVEPVVKQGLMGRFKARRQRPEDHAPIFVRLAEPLPVHTAGGDCTRDGGVGGGVGDGGGGGGARDNDTAAPKVALLVFQVQRALLCLLVDSSVVEAQPQRGGELYKLLQSWILQHVAPVLSTVLDCMPRSAVWDDAYHYVYYNSMNLAVKASLRRKGADVQDAMRYVEKMAADFVAAPAQKEAWARTKENTWVVGRRSGSREFYAVFDGKPALSDVHDEVKRISQVFFSGIFID